MRLSLLFLLVVSPFLLSAQNLKENLTAKEFYTLIQKNKNNSSFILLDVRTKEEFLSGHIEKAINIDISSSDFKDKIKKMDKNKTYLIYCRSGRRSQSALMLMKESGFRKIAHLANGINEWIENHYPVIRN